MIYISIAYTTAYIEGDYDYIIWMGILKQKKIGTFIYKFPSPRPFWLHRSWNNVYILWSCLIKYFCYNLQLVTALKPNFYLGQVPVVDFYDHLLIVDVLYAHVHQLEGLAMGARMAPIKIFFFIVAIRNLGVNIFIQLRQTGKLVSAWSTGAVVVRLVVIVVGCFQWHFHCGTYFADGEGNVLKPSRLH